MFFIFCSCSNNEQPKQGDTFLYYPKENIYYDIALKEYYFFDSTQNSWQQRKDIDGNSLGKKVLITNASFPVYKDNEQHRLIYGSKLYTSSDEIRRKYIEDSLKSLPPPVAKKSNTSEDKKDEKKKSGFRKFWEKLFGKKEQ